MTKGPAPGRFLPPLGCGLGVLSGAVLGGWFSRQQRGLSGEVLTVPGAPAGFGGFRLVLVSDLHGRRYGRGNRGLLDRIRALDPHLIAVTGDLIEGPGQLPLADTLARGLVSLAPTYYVTGNHEERAGVVPALTALLEDRGVTVLSDDYRLLTRGGGRLALLGLRDRRGLGEGFPQSLKALTARVRREEGPVYTLLLAHRNHRAMAYAAAHIDLTLAGHGHGGLIRLPGTDGLWGHGVTAPAYTAGLYPLPYGYLAVSRGLGDAFPCFRLFNPPDLPLVVLTEETNGSPRKSASRPGLPEHKGTC